MKINGMSKLLRDLNKMPDSIDEMVKRTLMEFAQRIFNDAMANVPASIRASYRLESSNGGFTVNIYTDNAIAAYIEFGTGVYASEYLSGKDMEIKDEAIKFYVNGEGRMPARPYLFPAYYRHRDALIVELNRKLDRIVKQVA